MARKSFEECTPEEQEKRLKIAKDSFDDLFSPEWKRAEERAKKKMRQKKQLCPSCRGELRYVGGVNKPDMAFVPLGGSYHVDGLYQCIKCKDVILNPPVEYEEDFFTLTRREFDMAKRKRHD